MIRKNVLATSSLAWPVATLLVIAVYLHGASGPFLFDDFSNLNALGAHGEVKDWQSLWLYLSQGHSGPTGRPIALLSFLLDDNSWPSTPEGFKYTNILIHALNGCLLFWLQLVLLKQKSLGISERQGFAIALLGSLLWLAHPLFVSTVLYVVQRMALLSATFVLAGLLTHVYFRSFIESRPLLAYGGMTGSLGFWGLLAILSKENGALLPILVLVIETTIFSHTKPLARYWRMICLQLPTLCILAYLLYIPFKNGLHADWPGRGFSPYERLLSESRILWEYLLNLFSFRATGSGLFHDDYTLSTSLLRPITTLVSVIGILLVGVVAFARRGKWPFFSLAVMFFLAGHLIESTTVGLELYFEHRNYLPAVFLFVPLAQLVMKLQSPAKVVATAGISLLTVLLLFYQVDLWKSNVSLAKAWAEEAPGSIRAQRSAAIALTRAGYPGEALKVLDRAHQARPGSHAVLLHKVLLECSLGYDLEAGKANLLEIASTEPFDPRLTTLIETFIGVTKTGACQSLSPEYAQRVLGALMENPVAQTSDGFVHQLYYFSGVISSHQGDAVAASKNFSRAVRIRPRIGTFMKSLSVMASDGHCEVALAFSSDFKESLIDVGDLPPAQKEYYQREHALLISNLTKECVMGQM
ncbi:hypothetical protein [Microbulbifer sp. YPW16]|uniref:hypothetical protein n=1 Tax=Microbulbifer sp. YPW16 TaxID=2904242 RepID=UPI001E503074|nr:hypothetical protein [Microbulbifer sp. YPW16]UHQ54870.1 hypothetical protein LVE68_15385 [Microbulbifer sp. YPW16]